MKKCYPPLWRVNAARSVTPPAHRIAIETEHLSSLRVRVNGALDLAEISLHDRHVVGQFQPWLVNASYCRSGGLAIVR